MEMGFLRYMRHPAQLFTVHHSHFYYILINVFTLLCKWARVSVLGPARPFGFCPTTYSSIHRSKTKSKKLGVYINNHRSTGTLYFQNKDTHLFGLSELNEN